MRPAGLQSLPLGYTRLEYLECPYDVIQESSARFELGMFTYSIANGDTLRIQTKHRVTSIPTERNGFAGKEGFSNNKRVFQFTIAGHPRAHNPANPNDNVTATIENYAVEYDGAVGVTNAAWDRAVFIPGLKLDLDWHVLDAFMSKETLSFSLDSDKVSVVPWAYPTTTTQMLTCFGTGVNDNGGTWPMLGQKQWFKFWLNGELQRNLVPSLSPTGTPCMFDTVTRKPFYNSGTGSFIAGIDNQAQLDNMLRKLPNRTGQAAGTLTVRLADELKTSENLAKLDAMSAKNWTITQAV